MIIRLVTNPAGDPSFRRQAERLLSGGANSPDELQDWLKQDYPEARVVSGIIEQSGQRWYAYREGHWVAESNLESTGRV